MNAGNLPNLPPRPPQTTSSAPDESPAKDLALNLANCGTIDTGTVQPDQPGALAGLRVGRLVHFVMGNGEVRPLLITRVVDAAAGIISGALFFDGADDRPHFPGSHPLVCDDSGHFPRCVTHLRAVEFFDPETDPEGLVNPVDTWHWPKRDAIIAASVDAGAINLVVTSMLEAFGSTLTARITETVNAKVDALLKCVNDSLDCHSELVKDLMAKQAPTKAESDDWLRRHNLGDLVDGPQLGNEPPNAGIRVLPEQVSPPAAAPEGENGENKAKSADAPSGS